MKKGILFLLIISTVTAKAQSLKDLLYSGKLKMDSNSVIRKGDDLSSKIDTSSKKAEPEKAKTTAVPVDSSAKKFNRQADSAASVDVKDSVVTSGTGIKDNNAAVKSNNKIWKEYTDSLLSTLKTEVLTSKKIKKETYYLLVEYEIGTEGQVNITNVTSAPENSFLQAQVKDRLLLAPPQLNPVLDSAGKPRKVKRKYNFNVTKE
jgi:hypothetical protein